MNLNEYAAKGKNLFFDCPPIYFGSLLMEDLGPLDLKRYLMIDPEGNAVQDQRLPLTKIGIETCIPSDDNASEKQPYEKIVEIDHGFRYKRQLHPNWGEMSKLIYEHTGKSNLIDAAYEGGFRLQRRFNNMNMAFTYGYKLKYKDLDDPKMKEKIIMHLMNM